MGRESVLLGWNPKVSQGALSAFCSLGGVFYTVVDAVKAISKMNSCNLAKVMLVIVTAVNAIYMDLGFFLYWQKGESILEM